MNGTMKIGAALMGMTVAFFAGTKVQRKMDMAYLQGVVAAQEAETKNELQNELLEEVKKRCEEKREAAREEMRKRHEEVEERIKNIHTTFENLL